MRLIHLNELNVEMFMHGSLRVLYDLDFVYNKGPTLTTPLINPHRQRRVSMQHNECFVMNGYETGQIGTVPGWLDALRLIGVS